MQRLRYLIPNPPTTIAGPSHDFVQFFDALVLSQSINSFLAIADCTAIGNAQHTI